MGGSSQGMPISMAGGGTQELGAVRGCLVGQIGQLGGGSLASCRRPKGVTGSEAGLN